VSFRQPDTELLVDFCDVVLAVETIGDGQIDGSIDCLVSDGLLIFGHVHREGERVLAVHLDEAQYDDRREHAEDEHGHRKCKCLDVFH